MKELTPASHSDNRSCCQDRKWSKKSQGQVEQNEQNEQSEQAEQAEPVEPVEQWNSEGDEAWAEMTKNLLIFCFLNSLFSVLFEFKTLRDLKGSRMEKWLGQGQLGQWQLGQQQLEQWQLGKEQWEAMEK